MVLSQLLSPTRTLWFTFIATIVITFLFPVASSLWELTFLDGISEPADVRQVMASMSAEQRTIHAWLTATLDVAYPLAYGAWFIGSAYKFYGKFGWLVALPALVLVPTDLIEGVVQVLALTGVVDWIDAKAFLTPLKTLLFLFGLLATVVGWVIWAVNRFKNREA